MKYVEQGGDIRATSANPAYMGVVFQGSIEDALTQAKAAPDHGVPALNGRAELLAFLRVKLAMRYSRFSKAMSVISERAAAAAEVERDSLIPEQALSKPWDTFSPFSLEYAMARWPQNFSYQSNPRAESTDG